MNNNDDSTCEPGATQFNFNLGQTGVVDGSVDSTKGITQNNTGVNSGTKTVEGAAGEDGADNYVCKTGETTIEDEDENEKCQNAINQTISYYIPIITVDKYGRLTEVSTTNAWNLTAARGLYMDNAGNIRVNLIDNTTDTKPAKTYSGAKGGLMVDKNDRLQINAPVCNNTGVAVLGVGANGGANNTTDSGNDGRLTWDGEKFVCQYMTTSAVGTYGSLPSNNSSVNYGAGAVQPNTTGTPINNVANKIVIPTITVDADKEINFGSYAMTGGNAVTIDNAGNINVDYGYGLTIDNEDNNKIRIDLGIGDWCNAAGQGLYWASNDTFGCTTPYSWKVSATGSNTSTIAHDGTVTFAHGTGLTVSQASGIVTYGLSISGLDTATGICGADQRLTFGLMDDGVSYGFLCSYTLVASDGTTITNSGGSVSLATCSVGQVFKMVKTTGGSTRWQCSYQAEMRYVFWGDEGLGGSCEPQIFINTRSRCRVTYQDWDHNKIPLPYDPSYIAVVDVVGSGTPTAADCVADVDGADKEKVTVFCEYEMDNIKVSYGSGSTISYWDQYDAAGNGNTKETSAPSISVEHGDHWAEPGALVVIAYP